MKHYKTNIEEKVKYKHAQLRTSTIQNKKLRNDLSENNLLTLFSSIILNPFHNPPLPPA
jgi:hypothetical protein